MDFGTIWILVLVTNVTLLIVFFVRLARIDQATRESAEALKSIRDQIQLLRDSERTK